MQLDSTAAAPHASVGTAGRLTLWLCAAAVLLEGFDNQSMGVAAPRLMPELGLNPARAGLILSATPFGLFVGAALGGRAADYFGRKRALIASILMLGIFSLLTSAAGSPHSLLLARLLTGLGLGGAMPNFISLSAEAVPQDRRVSLVTLVMTGMPFGGATAGLIALGAHWHWSWRSIFYVGGTAPIILALVMMKLLPESKEFTQSRQAGQSDVKAPVASVSSVLFGSSRAVTTLLLWVGFFFTSLILLLMLNWLPNLLVGLGLTKSEASWGSVCFNVAGACGSMLLGRWHTGRHRRAWVTTIYVGMAVALVTVSFAGTAFAWTALSCALAGVFIIGGQLILFALAPLYYPASIRGTGVGAAVSASRLGSVVGPLFAGALLAGGGASATVLVAILPFVAIAGGAAYALTWRPENSL